MKAGSSEVPGSLSGSLWPCWPRREGKGLLALSEDLFPQASGEGVCFCCHGTLEAASLRLLGMPLGAGVLWVLPDAAPTRASFLQAAASADLARPAPRGPPGPVCQAVVRLLDISAFLLGSFPFLLSGGGLVRVCACDRLPLGAGRKLQIFLLHPVGSWGV